MNAYSRWLLVVALLGGCTAAVDPVQGAEGHLVGSPSALPVIPDMTWAGAIAGCEGLLGGDETFSLTTEALVVAWRNGRVVCVDTYGAIKEELELVGAPERAAELRAKYGATLYDGQWSDLQAPTEGDPNPQPNRAPQLSRVAGNPTAGDPNPQPNRPSAPPPDDEHHQLAPVDWLPYAQP